MCKTTIQQCEHCSNFFEVTPSKPNKRFCSRSCYDGSRTKIIEDRASICKNCSKKIIKHGNRKRMYCSNECRSGLAIKRCFTKCGICGSEFSAIKWNFINGVPTLKREAHKKYCSRHCISEAMRTNEDRKEKTKHVGKNHPNWKGGSGRHGSRGPGWSKIAERCRDIHGRVCKKCGKTEKENGRKLDVNHIIPFHQHRNKTAANRQSNLEALCMACHTSADWQYRKLNPTQILLDIFT